ncbi:ParB/RepB/Spo0J family partition protein [Henriciella barbarensis]|uniref:ParB/RepB/Spo0J family partition protein n=1 Tax=Henriciella barbarensis TaxID=86342 RepID=A0A399R3R5_9PROT|nr:ParB/RepB/Spo0J family partition protein [Henriciella barbarensis]RIJ24099.1 ParB/RepB/Spo0J family partition protein [Henriciella barbarensis]
MSSEKQKPSRLGRGLSALIGEVEGVSAASADEERDVQAKTDASTLLISDIRPNPQQPRRYFSEADLNELSESIRAKGVLQAILVRPDPKATGKYQIVAGERRWRAAKQAGLTEIPATIRQMDELELLEIGIIENVQRTDLNPIEEAEAYGALMRRFGRTQEGLAESVGKSRAHIANTLRLLNLSDLAREHLREGRISAGHARAALGAPDPDAVIAMALHKGLSVREVEKLSRSAKEDGSIETVAGRVRQAEKDVDTEALEADLARALGLSVDIRHKGDKGEMRIKYSDLEQLDDLCRRLTARRSAT